MLEPPVEHYDETLFLMVNAGLRKLKVDDCFWAMHRTFSLDEFDPGVGPIYLFASQVPDQRRWKAPDAPLYDILRVKKIIFGESKWFFGTKYTKAAELYVQSARYGDERQIIHPYTDYHKTFWYPFASVDRRPSVGRVASEKYVKPKYSDGSNNIKYATKADMVDFITFFNEKRQKEQDAREAEEARRLEKLLEEEKRRAREIDKPLDDIWK